MLTDNGRQFTGKFSRPGPTEVLFDRICRKNGIEHLLTNVRSPTTAAAAGTILICRNPLEAEEAEMRRLAIRRLVVGSVAGLLFALLNVSPAVAQPANDDFDSATVVPSLPFTDTVSTSEATTAFDDPFCGDAHSVWYSFTPTQSGTVAADTSGSDYTTALSVYTGSRGALSEVACAAFPAQVTFNATANTTYFFMVTSACCGGPGGTLAFNLQGPPANDEFSDATPLSLNTPVTQDTTLATSAPTDPSPCGPVTNTVWFSFTATQSQPLNLDWSASSYSGRVYVLEDLGGGPVVIACEFETVRFDATAGRTYFFMVGGHVEGGQLRLTLSPGIVMTLVVDQTGTVNRQGTADVTGTLSCNPAAGVPFGNVPTVQVVLRQRVSKTLVIEGSSSESSLRIPCPTAPTRWSATVIGSNGPFQKGQAEVFATGLACDAAGCARPEVRQLIRLERQK